MVVVGKEEKLWASRLVVYIGEKRGEIFVRVDERAISHSPEYAARHVALPASSAGNEVKDETAPSGTSCGGVSKVAPSTIIPAPPPPPPGMP